MKKLNNCYYARVLDLWEEIHQTRDGWFYAVYDLNKELIFICRKLETVLKYDKDMINPMEAR